MAGLPHHQTSLDWFPRSRGGFVTSRIHGLRPSGIGSLSTENCFPGFSLEEKDPGRAQNSSRTPGELGRGWDKAWRDREWLPLGKESPRWDLGREFLPSWNSQICWIPRPGWTPGLGAARDSGRCPQILGFGVSCPSQLHSSTCSSCSLIPIPN